MFHMWTKPGPVRPGSRPLVAVIDNDDAFRLAALRYLRRIDIAGVGLIDTTAAMRWLTTSDAVSIVFVDRARVKDAAAAIAARDDGERPFIIAISDHGELAEHTAVMREGADGLL